MKTHTPKSILELDLDRLQEVLDYDPGTGILSWRVRLSPRCKLGKPAGCVKSNGYIRVVIDKVSYAASHLAWFHFYGEPPTSEVDHQDLNKRNNRIKNLREATSVQNARNKKRLASNTTGYKGVSRFNNPGNKAKFRSSIRVQGKRIFLGLFHDPKEAARVYQQKVKELHGEFAREK